MRLGVEKGILNTNVVTEKMARPKYQSMCSVQTPRLLAYTIKTNVFTNPTKMLVAKIVGRTTKISAKVSTLTYEKENAKTAIEMQ
jgi:hypothetical protein